MQSFGGVKNAYVRLVDEVSIPYRVHAILISKKTVKEFLYKEEYVSIPYRVHAILPLTVAILRQRRLVSIPYRVHAMVWLLM